MTKSMTFLGAIAAACAIGSCSSDGESDAFNSQGEAESGDSATSSGADGSSAPASGNEPGGTSNGNTGPGDDDSSSSSNDSAGPKLDVGSPTGGFGSCDCELIYLWVADHEEGTVSKINTRTLVEEGRYLTREDGNGNPSRTSVNLSGDVAVANRHGGLVKFYAYEENCVESNGMPGIQTSSGKDDVLPWNVEECRAWYTPFDTSNQRPVAWTGDTSEPGNCDATPADVWTITSPPGLLPGMGAPGVVTAHLVDGETGELKHSAPVPGFPGDGFGAYGGAVDGAGNIYFSPLGGFGAPVLGRVDRDTLVPRVWDIPPGIAPYGITVDHKGRVWVASNIGSLAGRFDPTTETWDTVEGFGGGSGLAEGPDNIMYISQGSTVVPVQLDDLTKGDVWSNNDSVKGISFDADGFLWAVTSRDDKDPMSQPAAYKIDVMTMSTEGSYAELDNPYTYSDMTGNALGAVACAPEG